ncbi:MAG TPA: hypothetical protein VHF89_09815 [Solirubrobacteraceae bacterium]|nr:hypothetical protein [Solirubrobacteraceae bacterium]
MTRIPDEHEAARALQQEFERLGRERNAATRHQQRRGRLGGVGRSLIAAVAAALAAAAVAVAATRLLAGDDPTPTDPLPLPPSAERAPADARMSAARVPDPVGGLPWGARLYTSRIGSPCVFAGRIRGGELGTVRAGRFVPYPSRVGGTCASRPGQHLVLAVRRTAEPDLGRAILYGIADRAVSALALDADGWSRRIAIAPDGVFLHVARGPDAFHNVTLVAAVAGRERRFPLVAEAPGPDRRPPLLP